MEHVGIDGISEQSLLIDPGGGTYQNPSIVLDTHLRSSTHPLASHRLLGNMPLPGSLHAPSTRVEFRGPRLSLFFRLVVLICDRVSLVLPPMLVEPSGLLVTLPAAEIRAL